MMLRSSACATLFILLFVLSPQTDAAEQPGGATEEDDPPGPGDDGGGDGAGGDDADGPDGQGPGGMASLDLSRLQNTLKSGGVSGLNSMLRTFQDMSKIGGKSDVASHIKKDANGNEMYDFRDIDVTTPAPSVAKSPPTVSQVFGGAQPPMPDKASSAASAPLLSQRFETQPPRLGKGATDAKLTGVSSAPSQSTKRSRREVRRRVAPDPKTTQFATLPSAAGTPSQLPTNTQVEGPPGVSGALSAEEQETAALANTVAGNQGTPDNGSALSVLSKGLMVVRQSVDALLSAANSGTRLQGTDAPHADTEVLRRLEALESENQNIRKEVKMQSEEMSALKREVTDEKQEVHKAETENAELRSQLRKESRSEFQLPNVKTFFHKKLAAR